MSSQLIFELLLACYSIIIIQYSKSILDYSMHVPYCGLSVMIKTFVEKYVKFLKHVV